MKKLTKNSLLAISTIAILPFFAGCNPEENSAENDAAAPENAVPAVVPANEEIHDPAEEEIVLDEQDIFP